MSAPAGDDSSIIARRIAELGEHFEAAWHAGQAVLIEDALARTTDVSPAKLLDELVREIRLRRELSQSRGTKGPLVEAVPFILTVRCLTRWRGAWITDKVSPMHPEAQSLVVTVISRLYHDYAGYNPRGICFRKST